MLHNDKQIECNITNNIVNIYTNIIIMQTPVQNDSHTHDQYVWGGPLHITRCTKESGGG